MRRIIKNQKSKILTDQLVYSSKNSSNNKKIAEILFNEQKSFCAYTEEFLSSTDAKDIDHFNPTLKDSDQDNYENWFIVKHKRNLEKASKWANFQPVLHPTADDFEERILYSNGDYIVASTLDTEANNLIKLLQLDDVMLAENRKKYIARKRKEIEFFNMNAIAFFEDLLISYPSGVSYIRAIKEEFDVNLEEMFS